MKQSGKFESDFNCNKSRYLAVHGAVANEAEYLMLKQMPFRITVANVLFDRGHSVCKRIVIFESLAAVKALRTVRKFHGTAD